MAERARDAGTRQFASMTDPAEYQKLLCQHERRISHKAMLAALMISLHHQTPCFQQPYEMLRALMDMDGLMNSWRRKMSENETKQPT